MDTIGQVELYAIGHQWFTEALLKRETVCFGSYDAGSYYAYKFQYRGKEYYRSTGTENRREAEAIAGAARTRIVRQAAGLEESEPQRKSPANDEKPKGIPTLRQFQTTFDEWVATAKAEQHGTVKFYQESYRKLLRYGPWADLPLDQIDELTSKRSNLGP